MIIKASAETGFNLEVRDIRGQVVPNVTKFNTETKEIEVILTTQDGKPLISGEQFLGGLGNHVARATFTLEGAKLFDKTTGLEVE